MNYSTLIFDAFDTVVHINDSKLPTYWVDGEVIPTTAPAVHAAYTAQFGKLDFDVFFTAFSQSSFDVAKLRRAELREIPSQERFRIMLRLLGHGTGQIKHEIVERLTVAHMDQLEQAFEVRPETIEVLNWARQRFRIGMISNFAYAPTLYRALDRFGIRSAFEAVMVSVEVGWCKPHRLIFERTLEHMGIGPSETLFVGDQLYLDVYGALNSGMDVAWIETRWQEWLLPNVPRPEATYRVRSILELINLLEKRQ